MRQLKRIIIEGMDGTGKTTLIDYLMMHFPNLEMVVNQKGPDQDFNTWWPAELDRPAAQPVPLHDRFFYSELVYGPVLRGHIAADPTLVQNALWFLRSSALLIYARPHSGRIILDKPQMEGVSSNAELLLQLYDELMEAEKNWYPADRFFQYVWHREGEFQNIETVVKKYLES